MSYSYDRLPPSPDRAIVESGAHSVIGALAGTLGPQTQATVQAGFRHQTNPLATGESRSYDGLILGGSLRRELGSATSVELGFNRSTDPSGYDTNAYYVNNSVVLSLNAPLPFEAWLRGAVGWLRNDYPNVARRARRAAPRRHRRLEPSGSAATWAGAASSAPTTAAIGAPRTSRATTSRRPGS